MHETKITSLPTRLYFMIYIVYCITLNMDAGTDTDASSGVTLYCMILYVHDTISCSDESWQLELGDEAKGCNLGPEEGEEE